jgi:hypothetical protein
MHEKRIVEKSSIWKEKGWITIDNVSGSTFTSACTNNFQKMELVFNCAYYFSQLALTEALDKAAH